MSRIGKKPITIPEKVDAKINGDTFTVKGALGELSRDFKVGEVSINIDNGTIVLEAKGSDKKVMSLWGTYASHIKNMIEGVTKGFEKKLVIEGVGYKAQKEGNSLVLNLGFSHPIKMDIPQDLKVNIEKGLMSVSGINKESVGSFCAKVRSLKKPEPYKGKGIAYQGEVIRRKAGKKAATAAA